MTNEPEGTLLTDDEAEWDVPARRRFDWVWWGGQATVLGLTVLVTYLVLVLWPPIGQMAAHPIGPPAKEFSFVAQPSVQYYTFIGFLSDGDEIRCEIGGDNSARSDISWADELFRQPPTSVSYQGNEYDYWSTEVFGAPTKVTVSCERPVLVQAGVPISWPRIWIAVGMIGIPLAGCVIATRAHRRARRDRE